MELTERSVKSIHQALTEFGYPVTVDWVRDSAAKMIAGEKPVGGPDMMIRSMLVDSGIPCIKENAQ